ncbi:hypothetical protein HanIR_Chr12g0597431 [Helianthus annuus]|nr:hypothetical protein HanIR_Chr12g0597431 [Helianthus annuus]
MCRFQIFVATKSQTTIPTAESKGESEDELNAKGACIWKARCRSQKHGSLTKGGARRKDRSIEILFEQEYLKTLTKDSVNIQGGVC